MMKKMILLVVSLSYFIGNCASEEIKKPENNESPVYADKERVITGQIFRYPCRVYRDNKPLSTICPAYSSKKVLPREDTWFDVWATSPESENWNAHGHSQLAERFPAQLPLSLFLKDDGTLKTDGDTVELSHTAITTKAVTKVVLTIQQQGHRGGQDGTFAECLKVSNNYSEFIKPYITEKGN